MELFQAFLRLFAFRLLLLRLPVFWWGCCGVCSLLSGTSCFEVLVLFLSKLLFIFGTAGSNWAFTNLWIRTNGLNDGPRKAGSWRKLTTCMNKPTKAMANVLSSMSGSIARRGNTAYLREVPMGPSWSWLKKWNNGAQKMPNNGGAVRENEMNLLPHNMLVLSHHFETPKALQLWGIHPHPSEQSRPCFPGEGEHGSKLVENVWHLSKPCMVVPSKNLQQNQNKVCYTISSPLLTNIIPYQMGPNTGIP